MRRPGLGVVGVDRIAVPGEPSGMFSYRVSLLHPSRPPRELGAFLEWDLNAEDVVAEPLEDGGPIVLRFRHPWVEPETVASRLRSEFGAEARVERTAVTARAALAPRPDPTPPAARPEANESALRAALAQDGLLDRRLLATGLDLAGQRALDRALRALEEAGEIARVSRHLFRARTPAPRPDPDAQAATRRARPLEAHEVVLLHALQSGEGQGPMALLAATGLNQGRLMSAATSLGERGLLRASGQGTRWEARLTAAGLAVAQACDREVPEAD